MVRSVARIEVRLGVAKHDSFARGRRPRRTRRGSARRATGPCLRGTRRASAASSAGDRPGSARSSGRRSGSAGMPELLAGALRSPGRAGRRSTRGTSAPSGARTSSSRRPLTIAMVALPSDPMASSSARRDGDSQTAVGIRVELAQRPVEIAEEEQMAAAAAPPRSLRGELDVSRGHSKRSRRCRSGPQANRAPARARRQAADHRELLEMIQDVGCPAKDVAARDDSPKRRACGAPARRAACRSPARAPARTRRRDTG